MNRYNPIDSMSPKIVWMTSKNIVLLKKAQDDIFFKKSIETTTYWIDSSQSRLTFEIRDQSCYNPFLGPRTKKEKIYINIYSEEIGKNNNSSRMLERTENDQNNWLRRLKKIQRLKFWQYILEWWEPC
jgi:hypothetical protein